MSFTLISQAEPVARKDYRCFWCGEPIPKGEKHYHYTGKFEGNWQDSRMHLECRAAMHRLDPVELNDGFMPESFARGCCCEHGACECSPTPSEQATAKPEGR